MTIRKAKLNKQFFSKLPETERESLVSVAHLQNEIKFSLYGLVWTNRFDSENDIVNKGQISYNLYFFKILVGKMYEGWKMVNRFLSNKKLSTHFKENGCPDALAIHKELKKYFSNKNPINAIRNDISFHYSPRELGECSLQVPEDLEVYISEDNDANTLYYFAEVAANWSMLSKLNYNDDSNPLEALINELISMAKKFYSFNMLYLSYLFKKHSPDIWEGSAEELELEKLPLFSDVKIPAFTDTSQDFV